MQDYPAAHSMDTEWFAVDVDGNLAIFHSGEGGAVPESNYKAWQTARIDELDSFLLEIAKNFENRVIHLNLPGDAVAERSCLGSHNHKEIPDLQTVRDKARGSAQICTEKSSILPLKQPVKGLIDGWLLLLTSDEVIAHLRVQDNEYNYVVRFLGEPSVVFVRECSYLILQNLWEEGHILAGKALRDYRHGLATLFGLFVYWMDSGAPLPYTCIGEPLIPLHLEDLPENLQDAVSWNWFDRLRFSESKTIQPIEHTPCSTWSCNGWWMDTSGQEHTEHPNGWR